MVYLMPPELVELPVLDGFAPVQDGDAERLLALEAAEELLFTGEVSHTLADLQRDLAAPDTYHWVKWGPDGSPLVFAGISNASTHQNVVGWLTGSTLIDDELGVEVCRFLLRAAKAVDGKRPIHMFTYGEDTRTVAWYEKIGGTLIRRFARMDVALDGDQPPTLAEGITIRLMQDTDEDWRFAYQIIDTAFLDHFGHQSGSYEDFVEHEKTWVTDLTLCWLCFVDDQPAAALLGKQRPNDGYVGVLGTLKEFRGRGLGRSLLRTSFAEFAKRGEKRASLNVDLTNPTGAVGLYESVGMRVATTDVAYEFPVPD